MSGRSDAAVAGGPGAVPVADLSYTEASRELDEIVAFFEQREVDVDLLVARLERATTIVDELDRRLRRTKAQVEQLVPKLEAAASPDEEPPDGTDGPVGDEAEPDDPDAVDRRAAVQDRSGARTPGDPQGLF